MRLQHQLTRLHQSHHLRKYFTPREPLLYNHQTTNQRNEWWNSSPQTKHPESKTCHRDALIDTQVPEVQVPAASQAPDCPAHNCNEAAATYTSFLNTCITTFLIILLSTSPTPIGQSPGFLSSGMSLQAKNASRDEVGDCPLWCSISTFSMHTCLVASANSVLSSSVN